jgi:hypothetical protein
MTTARTYGELIGRIESLPASSPERARLRKAQYMFETLVHRDAWFGCRDWDGLDAHVKAAFMDMVALAEVTPLSRPTSSTG